MRKDPIVEEVRAAGCKLLADCGGDMRKLAARLRADQARHADRIVRKGHLHKTRPEPSH